MSYTKQLIKLANKLNYKYGESNSQGLYIDPSIKQLQESIKSIFSDLPTLEQLYAIAKSPAEKKYVTSLSYLYKAFKQKPITIDSVLGPETRYFINLLIELGLVSGQVTAEEISQFSKPMRLLWENLSDLNIRSVTNLSNPTPEHILEALPTVKSVTTSIAHAMLPTKFLGSDVGEQQFTSTPDKSQKNIYSDY